MYLSLSATVMPANMRERRVFRGWIGLKFPGDGERVRSSMFFRPARLVFLLLPLCLGLAACREAKVASYRVPKEKDPVPTLPPAGAGAGDAAAAPGGAGMAGGSAMANTAVPTASGPELTWTAPAGWVAKAPSAMRKATYAVPGNGAGADGDFSVTAFPSDVGGELANINRWRGQVHLDPLTEADVAKTVTRLDANGLHLTYVDFGGGEGPSVRMLGAIVPYAGATWFFKLGPASDALITREKPAFEAFLKSLTPAKQP